MPTQLERMRAPMLRMGGERNIRGMSVGMRGEDADLRRIAMGAGQTGAPIGSDGKPMDVVYNQAPEQFEKKYKLEKQDMELRRENNAMLNSVRAQDAESRSQRAQSYEDSVNKRMDEAAKIMQQYANQMGIEGFKQGGRREIAGMNNTSREGIASGRNATAEEIARGVQAGANYRSDTTNETRRMLGGNDPESASEQNQRFREWLSVNPTYKDYVTYENGGYTINAPSSTVEPTDTNPDMDTWRKINKALRGDETPLSNLHGASAPLPGAGGSPGLGGGGVGQLGVPKLPGGVLGGPNSIPEGTFRTDRQTGQRSRMTNGEWVPVR